MGDAVIRHLFHRVRRNPVLLEGELEERAEDAATVVVGLERRHAAGAKFREACGGKWGDGGFWEVCAEEFQFLPDAGDLNDRDDAPFGLARLRGQVFGHRFGEELLSLRGTVVGQRVVDAKGQGLGRVAQPEESGLGCGNLGFAQACDHAAQPGFVLRHGEFEGIDFRTCLGVGGEVLADPLTVEPTGNAINYVARGIGELGDDERGLNFLLPGRFATSTGKSVGCFPKLLDGNYQNGGEGGIRTHGRV